MSSSKHLQQRQNKKLVSFWLNPLLVGSFLAVGYQLTHRVMIMKYARNEFKIEFLKPYKTFPVKRITPPRSKIPDKQQKSDFKASQEEEMQTLLNALGTNWDNDKKDMQTNSKRHLNGNSKKPFRSNAQQTLMHPLFIELLETLPEP